MMYRLDIRDYKVIDYANALYVVNPRKRYKMLIREDQTMINIVLNVTK